MQDYYYYKQALKDFPKPCAFLDMDALDQNITKVMQNSNNKNIRIASKSIRSADVLRYILDSSPVFQGIMCFTADEAVFLSEQGFDDLLIAYPLWDAFYLKKIASKRKDNKTITVMADSLEHIEQLEGIAKKEDCTFLVCVDMDMSSNFFGLHFGVHRSPITTTEYAMAIINRIRDSNYLILDGIMGYEAQIAGVTDQDPNQSAKGSIIRLLKHQSTKELLHKRQSILNAINQNGISLRFVNGGGTGSLHQTAHEKQVTEVTVGSGFFSPALFDHYHDFQYQPAAGYALEITRRPAAGIFTCTGGGYTASGPAQSDKQPQVFLPQGAKLTANEGAGEVQTPIYYNGEIPLQHGDPIFMRHSKAGELCERFPRLHLIRDGNVIGDWTTYRGDNQCFL